MVLTRSIFNIEGGIAGLLINWTINFSITLQFLIEAIVNSEAAITSVERCMAVAGVEPEEDDEKR